MIKPAGFKKLAGRWQVQSSGERRRCPDGLLAVLYLSSYALISTAVTFFLGLFAAYYVIRLGRVGKGVIDSILTMPLILPPTVVGFFLLKIFGVNGPIGILFLGFLIQKSYFPGRPR
jgi:ABC-type molybdate transport system permease subunit